MLIPLLKKVGRAKTPGNKKADLRSTATTSRSFYADVGATITLPAGLICEEWNTETEAWVAVLTGATLSYEKIHVTMDSAATWETASSLNITIDGVALTFTVTTIADPATNVALMEDGTAWLMEDGSPVNMEG